MRDYKKYDVRVQSQQLTPYVYKEVLTLRLHQPTRPDSAFFCLMNLDID